MKYKEYKVFCETEQFDELVEKLNILGCNELVMNDPRDAQTFSEESDEYSWNYVDESVITSLEEGAWVSFYTNEENEIAQDVLELIKGYDFKIAIVDDEDWLHKWEEYFVPTKIGAKTVSKPVWKEYDPLEGEIVIDIDPGLAFGTGYSATTYLAVRLIEKYFKAGQNILDVGCGTGILSILCAKMGANHIDAVDLDPKAIESTKNNIKINNCEDKISVYQGDLLSDFDLKADNIAANLTAELVIRLADGILPHFNDKGILIASGIIDEKEEKVLKVLEDKGFEILEVIRDQCWVACACKVK